MRIGVNARLLLSENMEGIPRFTFETTRQMALDHPEDDFILFFDRKVKSNFDFPPNVQKIVIPLQARHPVLWYIWFELLVPLYLKKHQIDVFYSADGYLSLRTGIPTVMVMHDLAYLHFPSHISFATLKFYQYFVPKYLNRADTVIAVSEFVKNDIIARFRLGKNKVKVAYNAVSRKIQIKEVIVPAGIQSELENHPYFLYVGALHPRKNIIGLIRGFHHFNATQNGKYRLVLAGRMAWKTDDIKREIDASCDVIYIGMISESLKYQLLTKAEAMTYVSWFEGFGIPILEAMSTGCPVITSSVTSMPEVAGDAALLADPSDIGSISNAMQQVTGNVELRSKLIEKGYKRVGEFNWKVSAKIIYKELIEKMS
ncbi:MAG: glycosyltransferase family 4 protein [Saprospiraceae bacterium]|nr:glycosyltransferase family 4 protein [Saprospiraceae bacterium]